MTGREVDSERLRVLRDLIGEAETETPRTTADAMSRGGIVSYLRSKLNESERVELNGD